MKNKENSIFYDKKIQEILNKLISEEVIANNFYIGCISATCKCQSKKFKDLFKEIAIDELDDHAKHMIHWALNNEYSVPFKFKDYEKFASKSTVKQFENLKDDQEAIYYIDEAIKSEEDAIKSYENSMEYNDIPQDLNAILLQNYYDEKEHHEKLTSLKMGVEADIDILI